MNPLVKLYRNGSVEQHERGRAWYPTMRRICTGIALRTNACTEHAAAVLAVTSPGAQLALNLRWAAAWAESPGTSVGRYPARMVPACALAWDAPNPGECVTGVKVEAFYRAIMGHKTALVLDRWALRLATGSAATTAGNRKAASALHHEAAVACGEHVRDMQAIIWTIGREAAPKKWRDVHDLEHEYLIHIEGIAS